MRRASLWGASLFYVEAVCHCRSRTSSTGATTSSRRTEGNGANSARTESGRNSTMNSTSSTTKTWDAWVFLSAGQQQKRHPMISQNNGGGFKYSWDIKAPELHSQSAVSKCEYMSMGIKDGTRLVSNTRHRSSLSANSIVPFCYHSKAVWGIVTGGRRRHHQTQPPSGK